MQKIIGFVVLLALSLAGFTVFGKEIKEDPQKVLPRVEAKAADLAKSVDKTEEIKVSTLEKIEKQLNDLDAQKNERMKVEIERDRKGIEFWFAALAIMTTFVAAVGALFPFFMARKDKELLKVELAGVKNDRADIQRMKDDVQKVLDESKTDGAAVKKLKDLAEKDRAFLLMQQPDDKSNISEREKVIQAADRVIKSSENLKDTQRAEAIKASERDDFELALLLWQRFLTEYPEDAQASFYVAYCMQQILEKNKTNTAEDFSKIRTAYGIAEKNDRLENSKLNNEWIPYNWGLLLDQEALNIAHKDLKSARLMWSKSCEKYGIALRINKKMYVAANNWGNALDSEATWVAKTDIAEAQVLWKQAGEKYSLALKIKIDDHSSANNWCLALLNEANVLKSTKPEAEQKLLFKAKKLLEQHTASDAEEISYNLACVYSRLNEIQKSIEQLEIARFCDVLPPDDHWLEDQDLANVRATVEYKTWYKTHFGDDKS